MSLTFIYGNPGTGKSEILYDKLIRHARENPFTRIFLVVPEQFTLETQKKMVRRSDGHVITNIDVVSFERLSFRAFEEIGMRPDVLEDHGKSLLLRKIASDHIDELSFLRANIRRIGYIDEIKSMLSELMQYAVTPADLEEIQKTIPKEGTLYHKLSDILIMYRGMEQHFQDSLLVAERLLDVLSDHAKQVPMLQNAVYAFDGFTGFTPVQEKLLDAIMQIASELYFTVTMDANEPAFAEDAGKYLQLEQLFYMSRKMIWDIRSLAEKNHIVMEKPVLAKQDERSRFAQKRALRHLEQNLFRPASGTFTGGQDEIQIMSCANPKEELEFAVCRIAKMVREDHCRYSDFAIVSANAGTYDKYAKSIMQAYHVPYFSDRKRDITYHPLTEAIRALLEIISSDFSVNSVFRLLKTGLMPFSDKEIHLFETYCIARGIRGHKRFQTPFRVPTRMLREYAKRNDAEGEKKLAEEMLLLNDIRKRFWDLMLPVYELFSEPAPSVRAISGVIYEFLCTIRAEEKIASEKESLSEEGREDDFAIYEQIWPAVIDLLDKYVSILGDECMDAAEYAEILDAGFSGIRIGILPPGSDCVILGDIERTRLDGIRYLFFLGLNDGIIPQNADQGGMLSQYDREQLAGLGLRLAPTAREDVFLQRFYLYWNLTRPSEGLFLTYARLDPDGNAIRPSYLVSLLTEMFPAMRIDPFPGAFARVPLTEENGLESWLSGLDQAATGEITPLWKAEHQWFLSNEKWQDRIRHYMEIRFAGAAKEQLPADTARLLYGNVLSNSVSRLERFIRCPYQHFLDYGLRLKDREEFSVSSLDLGTMMHDVLARFSQKVEDGAGWMQIGQTEWENCLSESILETELGQTESVLYDNATNMHRLDTVRRILFHSVEAMMRQIRTGAFLPSDYEMGFRIRYDEKLFISGRIDRCDLYADNDREWVRIIDYKSGNNTFDLSDFYHGLSMQLVLYTEAVMREYENRGKAIHPAGMFYYRLDDPVIDQKSMKADESLEDAVFASYKLRGLVNSAPEVYRNMDKGLVNHSMIIPVELKNDGSLASRSKVADENGFAALQKHAVSKCVETGRRILDGEIDPVPYEQKTRTGCDYCDYRGICGFDLRIPGYRKNGLPALSDKEVWEKLSEEIT